MYRAIGGRRYSKGWRLRSRSVTPIISNLAWMARLVKRPANRDIRIPCSIAFHLLRLPSRGLALISCVEVLPGFALGIHR
jgi:hypothetical protein